MDALLNIPQEDLKQLYCDDSICEFVPLCLKCHGKIDHNRDYLEEIIMDKLEVMKCE